MRTIETTDLIICADCAHVISNGTDHDPDKAAHLLVMFEHTKDWEGHLVVGEPYADFSHVFCDTCGTKDAGYRYHAALLTEVKNYGYGSAAGQ